MSRLDRREAAGVMSEGGKTRRLEAVLRGFVVELPSGEELVAADADAGGIGAVADAAADGAEPGGERCVCE